MLLTTGSFSHVYFHVRYTELTQEKEDQNSNIKFYSGHDKVSFDYS
jgi:hypothetical protein